MVLWIKHNFLFDTWKRNPKEEDHSAQSPLVKEFFSRNILHCWWIDDIGTFDTTRGSHLLWLLWWITEKHKVIASWHDDLKYIFSPRLEETVKGRTDSKFTAQPKQRPHSSWGLIRSTAKQMWPSFISQKKEQSSNEDTEGKWGHCAFP